MGVDNTDISQIESMANLMYKLGPAIVILSVFLLLFLVIIVAILKGFMDNQSKTQEQNDALLKALMENFEELKNTEEKRAKATTKPYDEKNIVEIFVKLNRTFKMDCKKYSEELNCDRLGIYVFHNGTYSSHGLPFFKVSCISEWIKRGCGISSQIKNCSGVPLTVYEDMVDKLYTYGVIIVHNTYDNEEKTCVNPTHIESTSFYLEKDKAKIAIAVAVYDSNDNVFAFIMAEYLDEIDDENINKNIECIKEFCSKIRPTLEFSDYSNATEGGDNYDK